MDAAPEALPAPGTQKPVSEVKSGDVVRAFISTGQVVLDGIPVELHERPFVGFDGQLNHSMVRLIGDKTVQPLFGGVGRPYCDCSRTRLMTLDADGVWQLPIS